ncbi:MAG: ComEC/Rec2 family competence protein [Mesorhizobium sp.]|nr:ComEC/Rec2 family competence protein [Mesorhizobium sp.]
MEGQGTRETASERGLFAAAAPAFRLRDKPPDQLTPPDAVPGPMDGARQAISLPGFFRRAATRLRNHAPWPILARDLRRSYAAALDLEAARGAAFLLSPVLFCVGATSYFAFAFEPDFSALATAAGILAVAAWLVGSRPVARPVLLALLLVVAGMLAGKVETWRAGTRTIGGEIGTRLTGRVETIEHRANGRVRLTLAVLATERPTLRYRPDRVRVTARAIPAATRPGSVVEGVVRLLPPLGPLRPDSYDFAFESYFDGIGASGFFLRDPQLVSVQGDLTPMVRLAAVIEAARTTLAARIRGHIGGAEGEIAAALVAGVRGGIPEEANEALRITGLAHVLSISGLHMALVAGVVIATLRAGFALFPGFASRHPVRKYAAVAALVALSIYLVISGVAVAAERSYIMIAIMLVALLFDHAALTMRNLAIAAFVILIVTPHEAAGPSFQMSFAATAALIAAYGWWSARRSARPTPASRDRPFVLRALRFVALSVAALAATSVVAGTATGIFGAWHFQRVSPLGLVANLAAMPIVSLIVMPSAVMAMVLMPLDLDGPAFVLMGKGLSWMLQVAGWLAARTPFDAIGAIPAAAVVLLALALAPLTIATTFPMRLLCLPLLAGGLALIALRDLPDAYVSEDARLVAVRTGDGGMAVNRARPNPFTIEDWSRAMRAERLVKPEKANAISGVGPISDSNLEIPDEVGESADAIREAADVGSRSGDRGIPPVARGAARGGERNLPRAGMGDALREDRTAPHVPPPGTGFACGEKLCLARHATGAVIAHAETMAAAETACAQAAVIVIADATAANPCPHRDVKVITARHLALRGSAQIAFDAAGKAVIRHAIAEPLRPWHDHRRFSRAARGMAPYVAPTRQPRPAPAAGG